MGTKTTDATLPPELAGRVDAVCDRFEKAWRAGHRLPVEDLLAAATEAEQPIFLRELIALEMELRLQQGEEPLAQDYYPRFRCLEPSLLHAMIEKARKNLTPPIVDLQPTPESWDAKQQATVGIEPENVGRIHVEAEPIPGFRLVKKLGKGGFGEVWEALAPGGIRVAMKFVSLRGHAGAVELQALQVIKEIRHPHLLFIFGAWEKEDWLIIGMELADQTLKDRFDEVVAVGLPGISFPELLKYSKEAARVIDFLNKPRHFLEGKKPVGIHHGDIKPQNILLVGGGVKLGDFGLVRLLERHDPDRRFGLTPAFAAPESFLRQSTRWSDQYSLAMTYCYLRTGRLPARRETTTCTEGEQERPLDLSMVTAEERPALRRALAANPRERWPNCRMFIQALAEKPPKADDARKASLPSEEEAMFSRTSETSELSVPTVAPTAEWISRSRPEAAQPASEIVPGYKRERKAPGDPVKVWKESGPAGDHLARATRHYRPWVLLLFLILLLWGLLKSIVWLGPTAPSQFQTLPWLVLLLLLLGGIAGVRWLWRKRTREQRRVASVSKQPDAREEIGSESFRELQVGEVKAKPEDTIAPPAAVGRKTELPVHGLPQQAPSSVQPVHSKGMLQDKLDRIRPPRVQITFDTETGGAAARVGLPFVVGVMADFTGHPLQSLEPFNKRRFVEIDRDNFDSVLQTQSPRLALQVPFRIDSDDALLKVELQFRKFNDFDPGQIANQVPVLKELLETRRKLVASLESLPPREGELRRQIAAIDRRLSLQVAEIMHHPEFQKLEATWRGLQYLVYQSETGDNLKIRVLNISKTELLDDLENAGEFDQSILFKKVYEDEYDVFGGTPYGMLVGDYEFSRHPQDIKLLDEISKVAAHAHAPFIAAADPNMLNLKSFAELSDPRDLARQFETPDAIPWKSFRDSDQARFAGLTLPRIRARYPYGQEFHKVQEFNFEEAADGKERDHYLWMSAAWAYAARVTDAFALHGWFAITRVHTFHTDEGNTAMRCPTEVAISERREYEISKLGFLPLIYLENKDCAVFGSAQSCQKPREFLDPEARAAAELSAKLNYTLCTSRFVHYLSVIARGKMASLQGPKEVERFLNEWIQNYVDPNPEMSGPASRAERPFKETKIEVRECPGKSNQFEANAYFRLHFQFEGISSPFLNEKVSIPTKLPGTEHLPEVLEGHTDSVWSIAIAPDGRHLLSGSMDCSLRWWDLATRTESFRLDGQWEGVTSVAVSPDGRCGLSGSLDGRVHLWDLEKGKLLHQIQGHNGRVLAVAFSSDGQFGLSGGEDQTIKMWNGNCQEIRRFPDLGSWVTTLVLLPKERYVASGSEDGIVRLWDSYTGRELRRFDGHTGPIRSVALSPTEKFILSAGNDTTIRLLDAETMQEVRCYRGHEDWVRSVAFSPDGRWILSGSDDETVRLWNVETGDEMHRFQGHSWSVVTVAFSRDGWFAFSGSDDTTIRIWDLAAEGITI